MLYLGIAILIGITGGLGNAVISTNLPYLQGSLGLYQNEIAWLPVVYVIANVPTGIILIKYRQQFGLRSFAIVFQALYCLLTFAHLFVGGFAAAIAVRAASGMAASALTTLALNYAVQAFPASGRLKAIVIGIGLPQLAIPISRVFSADLIAIDQWRSLYLFEFGLAVLSFGAIALCRLPPSQREKSFEFLDVPTMVLFSAGIGLVAAVLGLGRFDWWLDASWIGWALAAAVPLFGIVFLLETHRSNPLIDMRWIGTIDFLRFVMVATVARIVLSEQTYGSIGLLAVLGYTNDQLFVFSLLTVAAAIAGLTVSAFVIGPNRLTQLIAFSIAIVALAAFGDSHATNLTRAPQMYLTQMLIAFSTTLYIGPAILVGFTKVLAAGGKPLTSFIAFFATTQALGGLIGTALLGTYQVYREKQHSYDIIQHLSAVDPLAAQSLQQGIARLNAVVLDPTLRGATAATSLGQKVAIEANVLAFNDVFRLVSIMATVATCLLFLLIQYRHVRARSESFTDMHPGH